MESLNKVKYLIIRGKLSLDFCIKPITFAKIVNFIG